LGNRLREGVDDRGIAAFGEIGDTLDDTPLQSDSPCGWTISPLRMTECTTLPPK
jgi:hypothetical protein